MATVADLVVKIGADSSALRKELNAVKRQLNTAFGTAGMELSKTALKSLAGIAAGITAIGVASVVAAADLQRVTTAFTNMLGSAEKSAEFVAQMQDFAAKTPFEFSQVTEAAQKFLAFGFTAEQVIPTLTAVGDAAAGVGLGADGINRITLALGQMAAKSKIQAGEMLQLTEAGIPAWQMLADTIGVTVPEAMKMVSNGMVDAGTGITAFVSGMNERFGGMMEQQSKTISGTWSTLMDGLEQTAAQVGMRVSEALDLTGIFQSLGDVLTNFALTVQSSGLAEAFRTAVPEEFQIAVIAVGTALTGIAIPAVSMMAVSLATMLAPFAAAVAAAAPFIAAATALATGIYLLWKNGIGLNEILDFMGVSFDSLGSLGNSLSSLFSTLGKIFNNLITAAKPLVNLIGVALAGAFTAAMKVLGTFVNLIVYVADVAVSYVNYILSGFNCLLEGINSVIDSISEKLSDMADSVLPDWARSGLSTVSGFVTKAVGWLTSLIAKITEANSTLSGLGDEETESDTQSAKATFKTPDYSQFKVNRSAESAAPAVAKAAGSVSSYTEEENYETTSTTDLEEIRKYVQELKYEAASVSIQLFDDKASAKLASMQIQFEKTIDSIEAKWEEAQDRFMTMTDDEKAAYLSALDEMGVAYQITKEGELTFEEEINNAKLAAYKEYETARNEYFTQCQDIRQEIEEAYKELSMERLQEALTEEAALRLSEMEAQQTLMEAYQEAYLAAHASTLELIADLAKTSLASLETAFTDIMTGAENAKTAFQNLGKAMLKVIAQYFAKMLAGQLTIALFGQQKDAEGTASTVANAEAAAAAWFPAAWAKLVVEPSAAAVATGLVAQGAAISSTLGFATSALTSATSSSGSSGSSSATEYARGGLFTRPLFGILGDGPEDEVALPLNRAVLGAVGAGIADYSGMDGDSGTEINNSLNVYGDINNAADVDDLWEGMNSLILSARRGF